MNQYDKFIAEFLLDFKTLSLEKIGTFDLKGNSDENFHVEFSFDKRSKTSSAFIDHISTARSKSRSVVESDVDSHLESLRQLLNVQKLYELPMLGYLMVNQSGDYTFDSRVNFSENKEDQKLKKIRNSEIIRKTSGSGMVAKSNSNRSALLAVTLVLVAGIVGVIGWGAYKLLLEKKAGETDTMQTASDAVQNTDTVAILTTAPIDSTKKDSSATIAINKSSGLDSNQYKFVHEITSSRARAYARTKDLSDWGSPSYIDSVRTDSSTRYTLYLKLNVMPADTLKVRDSLSVYFGKRVFIQH